MLIYFVEMYISCIKYYLTITHTFNTEADLGYIEQLCRRAKIALV